jgi:hypothetical protein
MIFTFQELDEVQGWKRVAHSAGKQVRLVAKTQLTFETRLLHIVMLSAARGQNLAVFEGIVTDCSVHLLLIRVLPSVPALFERFSC